MRAIDFTRPNIETLGCSSTSISAAAGMARAAVIKGEKRHAIAVIGDGAMTAGMAFEAMNNAGIDKDLPLIVILNDNDMSISPPVGALNRYLARLMSGQFYAHTKKGIGKVLAMAAASSGSLDSTVSSTSCVLLTGVTVIST